MDPGTWIAIATAATGAYSGYVSHQGARSQADAQQKAANYSAAVNAQRADDERATASENARRTRINNRRRLAAMRAAGGASGLAMEGSRLDALAESASILELQSSDVLRTGLARGAAFQQQGAMNLYEGGLMAGATRTAATSNLVSSFVSAGSAGYNVYRNF